MPKPPAPPRLGSAPLLVSQPPRARAPRHHRRSDGQQSTPRGRLPRVRCQRPTQRVLQRCKQAEAGGRDLDCLFASFSGQGAGRTRTDKTIELCCDRDDD